MLSWSLIYTQSLSDGIINDIVDFLPSYFYLVFEPNEGSLQSLGFTYSSISIALPVALTSNHSLFMDAVSLFKSLFSCPLSVTLLHANPNR